MGYVLKAHCVCGYDADLIEGCGWRGPDPHYDLARCDQCREIVSIRSTNGRRRCPKCRRAVHPMPLERRREAAPTSEFEDVQCPRCGQASVVLALVALWD